MAKVKSFKIQMNIFILRIRIDKIFKLKSRTTSGIHNLVI